MNNTTPQTQLQPACAIAAQLWRTSVYWPNWKMPDEAAAAATLASAIVNSGRYS